MCVCANEKESECVCVSKHENRVCESITMCVRVHVYISHQWSVGKLLALDKAGIRGA